MLSGGIIEYIWVKLGGGKESYLAIEEFHPVDRAAYQTEAGWTCYDGDVEYFISQGTGVVWKQPENTEVGIAPTVKQAADRLEAEIAKAMPED